MYRNLLASFPELDSGNRHVGEACGSGVKNMKSKISDFPGLKTVDCGLPIILYLYIDFLSSN